MFYNNFDLISNIFIITRIIWTLPWCEDDFYWNISIIHKPSCLFPPKYTLRHHYLCLFKVESQHSINFQGEIIKFISYKQFTDLNNKEKENFLIVTLPFSSDNIKLRMSQASVMSSVGLCIMRQSLRPSWKPVVPSSHFVVRRLHNLSNIYGSNLYLYQIASIRQLKSSIRGVCGLALTTERMGKYCNHNLTL